jgi:FtsZ-binding cell division protein ZapB
MEIPYDHTDVADHHRDIMEKLSEPLEAPEEESPSDAGTASVTETETVGDDVPGDARSDEEHGTSEAPKTEDPPEALPTPGEDRLYAGRYKNADDLEQAYQRLETEFTRRNQAGGEKLTQLESQLQELAQQKAALEFRMRTAVPTPQLSPEKVQELREKAARWGVDEEMLLEQEREKLHQQAEQTRQAELANIQAVGQQAGIYLQKHPNAEKDLGTVAELIEANEGLLDVLTWQAPDRMAKSVKGLIDLMYDAAEARRLRAEVAEFPKRFAGLRQQVRNELAGQAARKDEAGTVAATARARAPKLGSGAEATAADEKQQIMALSRGGRRWYDED